MLINDPILAWKIKRFMDVMKTIARKVAVPLAMIGLCVATAVYFRGQLFGKKEELMIAEGAEQALSYRIHQAIVAGNYDGTLELLAQGLRENPDDNALKTLNSKLMEELEVDFRMHYAPSRRVQATSPSGDLVLKSEEPYYFTLEASRKCYIYMLQVSSSGNLNWLFPNSEYTAIPNPVPPGLLRIPGDTDKLHLDGTGGVEEVYLLACCWRQDRLEELRQKLETEGDPGARSKLIDNILTRLRCEGEATQRLPGLIYGMYRFAHEGANLSSS